MGACIGGRRMRCHPSAHDWRLFLDRRLSPGRNQSMSAHLDECSACLDVYYRLPPPLYRALGRPVSSFLPQSPREVEDCLTLLLRLFVRKRPRSEALVVGAHWSCEALLLHVASLACSRLRARGFTVSIHGAVFKTVNPPSRPNTDVALLIG